MQTRDDLAAELRKLRGELDKAASRGAIAEEVATEAGDQLEKAVQQAEKPSPNKNVLVGYLTTAQELVHLNTVRSFEKLTFGGGNVLDVDVVRVLEEVLPDAFGGSPLDYQLVEEAVDGGPGLRLLVHPGVGPLDSRRVIDVFLDAIASRPGAEQVVALQWRQAGMLQVERQPPLTTGSGKIRHLHRDTRLVSGR